MFTRLKSGVSSATNFVKRAVSVVINAVPGLALVAARAGSGVFNASKFSDYLARLLNVPALSSQSAFGIALASIGLIGAGVTNLYTRFFNSYRRELSNQKALPPVTQDKMKVAAQAKLLDANFIPSESIDFESQLTYTEEKEIKATFCHPSLNTHSWSLGYKASQVVNVIYGFGSGSSGIVSMNSLIGLLQLWMKFEYEGKCGENQSDTYKIILANLATALLIYANLKSFAKYNVKINRCNIEFLFYSTRLFDEDGELYVGKLYDENHQELPLVANKQGYLIDSETNERVLRHSSNLYKSDGTKLILQSGWNEISNCDRFGVLVGVILGTIGIWYSNQNLISIFRDKTLCHMFALFGEHNVAVPDGIAKTISATGAIANFITNGISTLGAILNQQENARLAREQTDSEQSEQTAKSEFGYMQPVVTGCIFANAVNMAEGTFVACTSLPHTLANRDDLTTHPVTIGFSVIAAALAFKYQLALDRQGETVEKEVRRQLRENQQPATPLITVETSHSVAEETTSVPIPIASDTQFEYPRGSLSQNCDPRLFGGSLQRSTQIASSFDPDAGDLGFVPNRTFSLKLTNTVS